MEKRLIAALAVLVVGAVLIFEGVKFITVYPASSLPMVVVGMVLLLGYCVLVGDLLNVRFRSKSMFIPLVPLLGGDGVGAILAGIRRRRSALLRPGRGGAFAHLFLCAATERGR